MESPGVNSPVLTRPRGFFGWFWDAPISSRRALLAACLGWALDAFDVMLYALVIKALILDLSLSTTTAGLLGSITLVASGIGGVAFGLIADRAGRRPAMLASILVYSVFTAACGLSQNVWQLAVFRFLLGLGMGGEWTSGAAMVSETWPDKHRGKAVAVMQSSWAVGYAMAALVAAPVAALRLACGVLCRYPARLRGDWIQRASTSRGMAAIARSSFHGLESYSCHFFKAIPRADRAADRVEHDHDLRLLGPEPRILAYFSLPHTEGGLGLATGVSTLLIVLTQAGTFLGICLLLRFVADACTAGVGALSPTF